MERIKVAAALSGGVDSAAAAYLLKKRGYDVIGVTMNLFDGFDVSSAAYAAKCLGIEHIVIDLRVQFERQVIDYFIDQYMAGYTPNPCVRCNQRIKYGLLLDMIGNIGFNCIAMGHYARICYDEEAGRYRLYRSLAYRKDQSYYLYHLSQEKLGSIVLPLEGLSGKDAVRSQVRDMMPAIAETKDSTDICFTEGRSVLSFIKSKRQLTDISGIFVNKEGKYLGRHNGVYAYTIGQKKGTGVYPGMCVISLRPMDRQVVLGYEDDLYVQSVFVDDVSYVHEDYRLKNSLRCSVKLCQWGNPEGCTVINMADSSAKIIFDVPSRGPAPGQAAVFYNGDEVLGGGTIRL